MAKTKFGNYQGSLMGLGSIPTNASLEVTKVCAELSKCNKPHHCHVEANVKGADELEAILDASMSHPHSVGMLTGVSVNVLFTHHQPSCSSQLKCHKPMKYYYIGFKSLMAAMTDQVVALDQA